MRCQRHEHRAAPRPSPAPPPPHPGCEPCCSSHHKRQSNVRPSSHLLAGRQAHGEQLLSPAPGHPVRPRSPPSFDLVRMQGPSPPATPALQPPVAAAHRLAGAACSTTETEASVRPSSKHFTWATAAHSPFPVLNGIAWHHQQRPHADWVACRQGSQPPLPQCPTARA